MGEGWLAGAVIDWPQGLLICAVVFVLGFLARLVWERVMAPHTGAEGPTPLSPQISPPAEPNGSWDRLRVSSVSSTPKRRRERIRPRPRGAFRKQSTTVSRLKLLRQRSHRRHR